MGLCPALKELAAFGTDGEDALVKALLMQFPNAVHLRCFLHFSRNLKQKMSELGTPIGVRKDIVEDILGNDNQSALASSTCDKEFEATLADLKDKWNRLERVHTGKKPQFHDWFVSYKLRMSKGVC